ncbi:MAG: cytochrome c oxidase subunit [Actinomycetota bacterium]
MSPLARLRRFGIAGALVAVAVFASSCGDTSQPQNVLDPEAPIARQLDRLWDPVFGIAIFVFVLVEVLVLIVAVHYRRRSDDDSPKQIHGNAAMELGWTIAPFLILVVVGIFTIANVVSIDRIPKGSDVMKITVTGHQWWWEYDYAESGIVTANELHIPATTVIDLRLTSADVIHSFWPPKLAGKLDAIPGRLNHMQIKTDTNDAGKTFWGQCAEYCGLSHANMRLKVVVHTPADFAKWESDQMSKASISTLDPDSPAGSGADLFRIKGCGGCHTIKGYTAGTIGPDLTHFMSRDVFAGAIFPNTVDELKAWLRNPPKQKPMMPNNGLGMPNLNLAENEISDLIAFLQTLK